MYHSKDQFPAPKNWGDPGQPHHAKPTLPEFSMRLVREPGPNVVSFPNKNCGSFQFGM